MKMSRARRSRFTPTRRSSKPPSSTTDTICCAAISRAKTRRMIPAPGLTPLSVLEKLSTIQLVDVCIPMLDGRNRVLPRHTQPEPDVQALMEQVRITLPPQPPPRIQSSQLPGSATNQSALLEETAI